MSTDHPSVTPSQKADKHGAITALLEGLAAIDQKHAEGLAHNSYGKDCQRLAQHIKNTYLNAARNKPDRAKLTVKTMNSYLLELRRAVKAANFKHPALSSPLRTAPYDKAGNLRKRLTLNGLIDAYPQYADALEQLRHEPAKTANLLKIRLLQRVLADTENVPSSAYHAIHALPVKHPILNELLLTVEEKERFKQSAVQALAKKALAPTTLSYAGILTLIERGLASKTLGRQAFALALACGRRSIELVHNASFVETGTHQVRFDGQAKKGLGIQTKGYEIYTLIPAAQFIAAFEAFREQPKIKALNQATAHLDKYERGRDINLATALTFNQAAKLSMVDIGAAFKTPSPTKGKEYIRYTSSNLDVVFKDARAIYTRICLDRYYEDFVKTRPMMPLAFAKMLLGHGAVSTQDGTDSEAYGDDYAVVANYDAFRIDYTAPAIAPTKRLSATLVAPALESVTPAALKRAQTALAEATAALEAFLAANPKRRATGARGGLDALHEKVIAWAAANPQRPITKTVLIKQIGAARSAIEDYLAITQTAMDAYNTSK